MLEIFLLSCRHTDRGTIVLKIPFKNYVPLILPNRLEFNTTALYVLDFDWKVWYTPIDVIAHEAAGSDSCKDEFNWNLWYELNLID